MKSRYQCGISEKDSDVQVSIHREISKLKEYLGVITYLSDEVRP